MKKITFLLLALFAGFSTRATHIVGGEMQLYWKQGFNYAIEMHFYYDDISATPELLSEDLTITAAIYEKVTNKLIDSVSLKRISDSFIPYEDVLCTNINSTLVRTRLLKYVLNNSTQTIELLPSVYNSKNGYYIVWERCCRNGGITNIVDPENVGQAFYMEFPSLDLASNGGYSSNSEPIFQPITGDFPCAGRSFTFDFSGVDPDGDSLVYSMVTPLAGHATSNYYYPGAEPNPPFPANDAQGDYPLIVWAPGYSATNAIHGKPPLSVDPHTGILSVNSDTVGLYAFGVLVQEYRKGVKLGEIRRDFQFWVIDCPYQPGPAISLLTGNKQVYNGIDTLNIQLANQDTCFKIVVLDSSTSSPYNLSRSLALINHTPNTPEGLFQFPTAINLAANSAPDTLPLCFGHCYTLDITTDTIIDFILVVSDDNCPNLKTDTLKFTALFTPSAQPCNPPIYTFKAPSGFSPNYDGKNDYFVIKGIEGYPQNTLWVYDQNGFQLFKENNYQNDWTGINQSGQELNNGLYYYVFEAGDKKLKGYVELRR